MRYVKISLTVFLSLFFLVEGQQDKGYGENVLKGKRARNTYKEKKEKRLSIEEQKALDKFATEAEGRDYENGPTLDDFQPSKPWTDTSRLFPIFVGCILLFIILLSYNYVIGLTADKEKVLKDLETKIQTDEEAHRKKMLQ